MAQKNDDAGLEKLAKRVGKTSAKKDGREIGIPRAQSKLRSWDKYTKVKAVSEDVKKNLSEQEIAEGALARFARRAKESLTGERYTRAQNLIGKMGAHAIGKARKARVHLRVANDYTANSVEAKGKRSENYWTKMAAKHSGKSASADISAGKWKDRAREMSNSKGAIPKVPKGTRKFFTGKK
jgi:hypothetical protein